MTLAKTGKGARQSLCKSSKLFIRKSSARHARPAPRRRERATQEGAACAAHAPACGYSPCFSPWFKNSSTPSAGRDVLSKRAAAAACGGGGGSAACIAARSAPRAAARTAESMRAGKTTGEAQAAQRLLQHRQREQERPQVARRAPRDFWRKGVRS